MATVYGHLLLIEARRALGPAEILAAVGWRDPVARRAGVEGTDVAAAAQGLQDARPEAPLTLFAVSEADRWSVLSDLTAALADAGRDLAALSAQLDARVLALRFEPGACGLAWFDKGQLRRRIDQVGQGLSAEGDPLPVEGMFGSPTKLDEDDLITVVQSLGVDVARLNRAAAYTVLAY